MSSVERTADVGRVTPWLAASWESGLEEAARAVGRRAAAAERTARAPHRGARASMMCNGNEERGWMWLRDKE